MARLALRAADESSSCSSRMARASAPSRLLLLVIVVLLLLLLLAKREATPRAYTRYRCDAVTAWLTVGSRCDW